VRDLRIIIPAHNEAGRIEPTLRSYCKEFDGIAEIVVVANGCTDSTAGSVRDLQREYGNLALIDIPARIGKGGAVRVGLSSGEESITGFVDADGSTPAPEFKRLFEICRAGDHDAVIGSRWKTGARVEPPQPLERRIASRSFNTMVRLLFGLGLSDTQCGAKLFKRSALGEILRALEVADFSFDIEVLWRLKRAGFRILEVPTVWSDHREGTKIQLLRSSWGMLRSILRLRLKETVLWRLPLLDRLGNFGIIPVKARPRVLLLGVRLQDALLERELGPFVALLRERGIEVTDAETETHRPQRLRAIDRARFFIWYAFAIPRDYDALVEVPGNASWIPIFSAKPSFLLVTGDPPRAVSPRHRKAYHRSKVLDLSTGDVSRAANAVVETALGGGFYSALFVGDSEQLALHYVNAGSGALERHTLQ
jgi:glycosyltransferase involved in cell wall biosynthesis